MRKKEEIIKEFIQVQNLYDRLVMELGLLSVAAFNTDNQKAIDKCNQKAAILSKIELLKTNLEEELKNAKE